MDGPLFARPTIGILSFIIKLYKTNVLLLLPTQPLFLLEQLSKSH